MDVGQVWKGLVCRAADCQPHLKTPGSLGRNHIIPLGDGHDPEERR